MQRRPVNFVSVFCLGFLWFLGFSGSHWTLFGSVLFSFFAFVLFYLRGWLTGKLYLPPLGRDLGVEFFSSDVSVKGRSADGRLQDGLPELCQGQSQPGRCRALVAGVCC